jgi:excisionase family DNA binding protein
VEKHEPANCHENQGEVMLPLLDPNDVAEILGISTKTVHRLVRERKLGCVQVTRRVRRFTAQQVRKYVASRATVVPVDTENCARVSSQPKKGGERSFGESRADLQKEIRSWQ